MARGLMHMWGSTEKGAKENFSPLPPSSACLTLGPRKTGLASWPSPMKRMFCCVQSYYAELFLTVQKEKKRKGGMYVPYRTNMVHGPSLHTCWNRLHDHNDEIMWVWLASALVWVQQKSQRLERRWLNFKKKVPKHSEEVFRAQNKGWWPNSSSP